MKTYVMKSGKLHKIGKSRTPHSRLKSFQTSNPDIELILVCDEDAMSEKTLHTMFTGKRRGLECFELSEADISVLSGFMDKPEKKKNKSEEFKPVGGETVNLYARVEKEIHTNLKLYSGIQGVSMSAMLNKLLKDNLPKVEAPKVKETEDE